MSGRHSSLLHQQSNVSGFSAGAGFCDLYPGKPWAIVHDFLALPSVRLVRRDGTQSLKQIIRTELDRTHAFAMHAQNVAGDDGVAADLERLTTAYWPKTRSRESIFNNPDEHAVASATPRGKPW